MNDRATTGLLHATVGTCISHVRFAHAKYVHFAGVYSHGRHGTRAAERMYASRARTDHVIYRRPHMVMFGTDSLTHSHAHFAGTLARDAVAFIGGALLSCQLLLLMIFYHPSIG